MRLCQRLSSTAVIEVKMKKLSTIEINGKDVFDFLQNQLTNDLKKLELLPKILAAWCNPKGRVIWTGEVLSNNSNYKLIVPADLAKKIVQRLMIFRFRARVEFKIIDEGMIENSADLIYRGQPAIDSRQTEKYTPHMLNLDLINAIDFNKGCYPGQEVIARIHYKGLTKRRTFRFKSESKATVGDKISYNGQNIGDILNAFNNDLLAVIPSDMANKELSVNDSKLKLIDLPYFKDSKKINYL